MFELGPLEVAFILIYLTGIACAVVGALTKRFDLRETIGALIFSLAVPVLGSLVVVVMLISKFGETPPRGIEEPR
jgi:heme A synthase